MPRRRPGKTHALWFCVAVAIRLFAAPSFGATDGSPAQVDAAKSAGALENSSARRVVREGIAVDFSAELLRPGGRNPGDLRSGDDVVFRFRISDTAAGAPLSGTFPAAWLARLDPGEKSDPRRAAKKAERFVSGGLLGKPDFNLNSYYVLALNDDPTITIVDPLQGFGGSKLLAIVALKSRGEDWALSPDQMTLFVSLPDSDQVAVVDTASWRVKTNVVTGTRPGRLGLQANGQYLWVTHNSGMTVLNAQDGSRVVEIPLERGAHDIAFDDESRFLLASNGDGETVSVMDSRSPKLLRKIKTGAMPGSVTYSKLARAFYVAHSLDGKITVIHAERQEIIAEIQGEPGLGQIRSAPGGRFVFALNPRKNLVHIIDTARNRIAQTADLEKEPDQISFSDRLAFITHRGSENALMIPLDQIGDENRRVPVIDFPAGQNPPGKMAHSSPAPALVAAPGESAVLVANAPDQAIYYYKEGMAAPMGNFSNYSHEPRALLVVDRGLRERVSPGTYETIGRLGRAGVYDVVFFLNTPRIVHSFRLEVNPDESSTSADPSTRISVRSLLKNNTTRVGQPVRIPFQFLDATSGKPLRGLNDVTGLAMSSGGDWHDRQKALQEAEGIYTMEFDPPEPGIYRIYVECRSLGLGLKNHYSIELKVEPAAPAPIAFK
jgi:DNA-binding beta-propeller fold protein YncE